MLEAALKDKTDFERQILAKLGWKKESVKRTMKFK
jgi:hypothetical protein